MDAAELARWTRFAAKGGIGKCTAVNDCVAEGADDLMFLKDDEVTVLMQIPEQTDLYLGYCEGVVGRFEGHDVRFHSKLKKPVMTKRSSTSNSKVSASTTSPSPSFIPADDHKHELSALRVLVSSPPPMTVVETPPAPLAVPALSPDYQMVSRTSSASDLELDTPVHAHVFETQRVSKEKTLVMREEEIRQMQKEEGAICVPETDTPLTIRPAIHATTPFSDSMPNPHSPSPSPVPAPAPIYQLAAASEHSYAYDDEPSTRISLALSDGEVGIGLSLLQDFAGGGGEAMTWTDSESESEDGARSGRSTPLRSPYRDSLDTAEGLGLHQHPAAAATSPISPTVSSPDSYGPPHPLPPGLSRPAQETRPSSRSVSSAHTLSTVRSVRSGTPSDLGEDWEGASDIYENYRYSRFSMTSRRSSHSQISTPAGEMPPPIPNPLVPNSNRSTATQTQALSHVPAQSIDSQASMYSRVSAASSYAPPSGTTTTAPLNFKKDRPPSLKLVPVHAHPASGTSPLLHTSFGSPVRSPSMQSEHSLDDSVHSRSSRGQSVTSSKSVRSPTLETAAPGAASSLRSQLENERGPPTPIVIRSRAEGEEGRTRAIVVDDEEDAPDVSVGADAEGEGDTVDSFASENTDDKDTLLGHDIENEDNTTSSSQYLNVPQSPYTPDTSSTSYMNPPLSPLSSFPLPPQQPSLRPPPMSDFLTVQPAAPGSNRTSLFLPHPNAPKPPSTPSGPMYARQASPLPPPSPNPALMQRKSPSPQLQGGQGGHPTIRALHAALSARYLPGGHMRRITIYGRCEWDLFSAGGPVPIAFSTEPPPPPPPVPVVIAPSPLAREVTEEKEGSRSLGVGQRQERRKSRSFSGMQSPGLISFEERQSMTPSPLQAAMRSSSNSPSTLSSNSESKSPIPGSRPSFLPSPLSIRKTSSPSMRSPPLSPPLQSPGSHSSSPSMPSFPARTINKLRKAQSSTTLTSERISAPSVAVPPLRIPKRDTSVARDSPSLSPTMSLMMPPRSATASDSNPSPTTSMGPPSTIPRRQRSFTQHRQDSAETAGSEMTDTRVASPIPSGSSLGHSSSLLKKMSLPSMRSRSVQMQRTPDDSMGAEQDSEMVHAQNVEFELIRPAIVQAPSPRTSEDSNVPSPLPLDGRPSFGGFLRADSPAVSMASGQGSVPRSPIGEPPPIIRGKPGEPDSIEAHRTRELKWMSLISQVPASQARKNKKIKKLIMEGVPSSVRYLVWAHLTDSKARGMPGIYVQLGKRERVQAFQAIERDAQKCYPDQPQLQTSQGTLVALLQSYLTMVPDIHYETGLAYIAGRLLILAPDEDAFWIFTSLMDLYLRPWFSVNTSQMEVDGSLFSKALEANDPPVAKKLYVDLGISQTAVCRPWLSSLFAESLPVEYLHRIWDIFLYEGVPFLFRIGMAIVHCCRHYMLSSTSEAAALEVLVHPPAACLPPNPEVFITLANSFKLKDDDVRKQRIKMEAQVKRQTQIRTVSTPGAPISLPKA